MSTLQIFILCYNRPDFARESIRSALEQKDRDFELIVSDNSTSSAVREMVAAEFPQVTYRFRDPHLDALVHFNACLSEATADHVCLFHDDDLLAPDFVEGVRGAIARHPQAVAIGVNAWIVEEGREPMLAFRSTRAFQRIDEPGNLGRRYFSRYQLGVAPLPGYVYATSRIEGLRFDPAGGKYSDVSWLMRVADRGSLVWVVRPLMSYRMHASNDGRSESIRDRLKLLAFFKRNVGKVGTGLVDDFRRFIYKRTFDLDRLGVKPLQPGRRRTMLGFLARYRCRRMLRLDHHMALLRKMAVDLFGGH